MRTRKEFSLLPKHLRVMMQPADTVTPSGLKKIADIVTVFEDIFIGKVDCTDKLTHPRITGESPPVKCRPFRKSLEEKCKKNCSKKWADHC